MNKNKKFMQKFNSDQVTYLAMIQDTIKRMADNSFKIKNWAVVVAAGLFGIYFSEGQNPQILKVLLFITLVFMFVDAYYLSLEKAFRCKYNEARTGKNNNLFDMRPKHTKKQWFKAVWSPSMLIYLLISSVPAYFLYAQDTIILIKTIKYCICGV